jgi:hypothetical protein
LRYKPYNKEFVSLLSLYFPNGKNINHLPQNIKNIQQLEQEVSQLTQRQNIEYWESFDKIYLIEKLPNRTSFYLIMVGLR